jgi:hypothetical protein
MQIHTPDLFIKPCKFNVYVQIAYNTFSDLLVLQFVTYCNFNNNNSL